MRVGVLVESLANSQLAFELVRAGNELVAGRLDIDLAALTMRPGQPVVPMLFATLPASEATGFEGVLVSTSLATSRVSLSVPGPSRRIFYVYDLEWHRARQGFPHAAAASVYRHPGLELVARCEDHARILSDAWSRPVRVAEAFDWEALLGRTPTDDR